MITPFLIQILLVTFAVGYISNRNGQLAVQELVQKLLSEVNARTETHLLSFLHTPHHINRLNAHALEQGLIDLNDLPTLQRHFWTQIQAYPSVTSIYFGSPNGGLANSGREGVGGSLYMIETEGFTAGAFLKYAVDEKGHKQELIDQFDFFDATTRPWFTRAVQAEASIWSDPYILFTGQDMAISGSKPVYTLESELLGVLGVDIFLSHISDFLSELEIGKTGLSFIIEPSGLLVASSTKEAVFEDYQNDGVYKRKMADESESEIIREAAAFLENSRIGLEDQSNPYQGMMRSEGKSYFLQAEKIENAFGIEWMIISLIPETDFMEAIQANNLQTVFLTILALILAVAVGLITARWISRPIERLGQYANQLSKGQWPNFSSKSKVKEVVLLKDTFEAMSIQLKTTIDHLNQEVRLHQQAEDRIEESYSLLHAALESTADGLLIMNQSGSVTHWNQRFMKMWHLKSDMMEQKDDKRLIVWMLRQAKNRKYLKKKIIDILKTPSHSSFHEIQLRDGRVFECVSYPQTIDTQVVGRVWSFRDITDRSKAEEALEYQLQYQKMVSEISAAFMNTPIEMIDTEVEKALQACATFFKVDRAYIFQISPDKKSMRNTHEWCVQGIEPQKPYLQDIELKVPIESFGSSEQDMNAQSKVETLILEAKRDFKQDSDHPIRSLLTITMVTDGEVTGFFGFDAMNRTIVWRNEEIALVRVVTEIIGNAIAKKQTAENLIRAKESAESASRAKSEFVANMSHELRTPLNGVIGFSSLMMETNLDGDQKDHMRHIILSANSLLEVIGDILDFSKIEAGKMDLNPEYCDCKAICQKAVELVSHSARKKGIDLRPDIPSSLPGTLLVDPVRLQQVLVNLLDNAVKFTEQGSVSLKLTPLKKDKAQQSAEILFEIEDTGIGIRSDEARKLFSAFVQADSSITRKYGGTGLGLVITDGILKKMGSHLQLKSEPGKGTTFSFALNLPCQEGKASQKLPNHLKRRLTNSTPSKHTQPLTILLVEDNPINQKLAKSILKIQLPEARILEAENGQEAIDIYRSQSVDLILMDVQMPVMDGLTATREIRFREKGTQQHLPIIAITAGATLQDKEKCYLAGMNDFVAKPITKEQIEEIIDRWIPVS